MDKEYFDFIKHAYSNGLCEEYRNEIRNCHEDRVELIKLALRQQCIPYIANSMHEGIIHKDYLLKSFGEYLNGFVVENSDGVDGYRYAWYVDYDYDNDLVVGVDVAHISFTVGANVVIPTSKCPTIYISNRSKVHLIGNGYNSVSVYMFDTSELYIEDIDEESSVNVYKYSDKCNVVKGKYCLGKVNEHDKELRL